MNDYIPIFELLDNFFGTTELPDVRDLAAKQVIELGQHVMQFYETYEARLERENRIRSYLGGYIASAPYLRAHSQYIYSSLLHSTVVADLLYTWFAGSRSRSGGPTYLHPTTKRPPIGLTKDFLAEILPWMYEVTTYWA